MKFHQIIALFICALILPSVAAAIDDGEKYVTGLNTYLATECPKGQQKFAYDGKSNIVFCWEDQTKADLVASDPFEPKLNTNPRKYVIVNIRGVAGTDASCSGTFGKGWEQFGWDAQAHIHYCMQYGDGREGTYIDDLTSSLTGCQGKYFEVAYNGNSNIHFCALFQKGNPPIQ
ncbi:hypothetical protein [Martelella sp. HB161492]|uniref:hypothetical protein n=1 Tax=Martelella sp. HB161492 TaxID=2720726 RepID=UPI001590B938|nr:hypothetical protein [Martelella sp. HB161492]